MSAESKAQKYITAAEANGWVAKAEPKNGDEWHVTATRGGETIYIWWRGNSLIETPKYTYNGHTTSLHNAAGATRQLGLKPDHKRAFRRRRATADQSLVTEALAPIRQALPFDIDESPKSEILKAIRGNKIVWLNSMTGLADQALVPYKMSGKNGVRLFNTDLKSTFYIKQNKDGRKFVSFMDSNGTFRAVYLDAILQVV